MKHALMVAAVAAVMVAGSASALGDYAWLDDILKDGVVNLAEGVNPTYSPWRETEISDGGDGYLWAGPYWRNPMKLGYYQNRAGIGWSTYSFGGMREDCYLQIDLGVEGGVTINHLSAMFFHSGSYSYAANSFRILWSLSDDPNSFVEVEYLGAPVIHLDGKTNRPDLAIEANWEGLSYNFVPVEARYIRIVDAKATWQVDVLFSDIVVARVPEPATMTLLALGGVALLRRRRR